MSMFTLAISCLTTSNLPWFMHQHSRFPCNIALYSIRPCFHHRSHPQLVVGFALAPSLHSFWSYFSTHLPTWGIHLSVSYLFAFSHCSQCSQGKNTEVVCHSLIQWTTFCQISAPWPICLGLPHTLWLSFIELEKAVVHVIRLASFLWLWFQSVCPLMPSLSAYHLTWVSLTLDVQYLFTASPEKCSCFSLPWIWGISSRPLLLSLDLGYLLTAAIPDIGRGIAPLGRRSSPWTWDLSSWLFLCVCCSCAMVTVLACTDIGL